MAAAVRPARAPNAGARGQTSNPTIRWGTSINRSARLVALVAVAPLDGSYGDRLVAAATARDLERIAQSSARLLNRFDSRGATAVGDEVLETVTVAGSRLAAGDPITNTQQAGIDEGDIVKKSGDCPPALRNGELRLDDVGPPADTCDWPSVDWYGDARLFLVGERVFGLSGDRLKEAMLRDGRLVEVRALTL